MLPMDTDPLVSAQVILRAESGRSIGPSVRITSENLAGFVPSQAVAAEAAALFRALGFDVGPLVGVSFSVTSAARTFERGLGIRLALGSDRTYRFVSGDGSLGSGLAGEELPEPLRALVQALVFTPSPDFGPVNFRASP